MRKLLRADMRRVWRRPALWLCVGGAFLMAAGFMFYTIGRFANSNGMPTIDAIFRETLPLLPIFDAVFVGLFLAIERQDGALRNKIICGHRRAHIYLSYFLAAAVGCLVILLAWTVGGLLGVIRLGWFSASAAELIALSAVVILGTVAMAAIYVLLCMLVPPRTAAVGSIVLALVLMVTASVFYNALCEPELQSGMIMTLDGMAMSDPEPNPDYVSGLRREVYQFIVDALPTGQTIQIANAELSRPVLSLCTSICLAILTTLAGAIAFRRKDLK